MSLPDQWERYRIVYLSVFLPELLDGECADPLWTECAIAPTGTHAALISSDPHKRVSEICKTVRCRYTGFDEGFIIGLKRKGTNSVWANVVVDLTSPVAEKPKILTRADDGLKVVSLPSLNTDVRCIPLGSIAYWRCY